MASGPSRTKPQTPSAPCGKRLTASSLCFTRVAHQCSTSKENLILTAQIDLPPPPPACCRPRTPRSAAVILETLSASRHPGSVLGPPPQIRSTANVFLRIRLEFVSPDVRNYARRTRRCVEDDSRRQMQRTSNGMLHRNAWVGANPREIREISDGVSGLERAKPPRRNQHGEVARLLGTSMVD
jgi:hypothetical protein